MINYLNWKLCNIIPQELATLLSCLNQAYSSPNSRCSNTSTFYLVITLAEPHSAGQNQSLHSPHPPFTGTSDLRKISISKSNHQCLILIHTNGGRFIPYTSAPESCLPEYSGIVFVQASSLLPHECHIRVAEVVDPVSVVVCPIPVIKSNKMLKFYVFLIIDSYMTYAIMER